MEWNNGGGMNFWFQKSSPVYTLKPSSTFHGARSEQHVVVWCLIEGGEFNADNYRRIVAVYSEHCLGYTSGNSLCKSFREGWQTILDLHDNVHPHVSHETKGT
ncbi:hypothetical protein TNCV_1636291 [Trichonephila clavipes]|uniref:Uncharacterized protein n=1 Tax=Trichonephila clavipes TaxID=2585209 RepID=A0A8X6RTD1_TRICX|nr:hypothetical protein TNCV_1636291 [Trichonephila clavipes]